MSLSESSNPDDIKEGSPLYPVKYVWKFVARVEVYDDNQELPPLKPTPKLPTNPLNLLIREKAKSLALRLCNKVSYNLGKYQDLFCGEKKFFE